VLGRLVGAGLTSQHPRRVHPRRAAAEPLFKFGLLGLLKRRASDRKRLVRTLKNIGRLFAALFRLHVPGGDLTIDSPDAATVPFGVAAAIAVVVYVIWTNAHGWRILATSFDFTPCQANAIIPRSFWL